MEKTNRQNQKIQKSKSCFLHLTSYFLLKKGQTFVEYTIVIGVVILIIFAMGPMMKRGIQSLIKTVADEIGIQRNADQRLDGGSYLASSEGSTNSTVDKQIGGTSGTTVYFFNDTTVTTSRAVVEGFNPPAP